MPIYSQEDMPSSNLSISTAVRSVTLPRLAGLAVAAVGVEGFLSAATPNLTSRGRLLDHLTGATVPSAAHLLALVASLALVVLAPRLWRGSRTALGLAGTWLGMLAILDLVKGLDYDEAMLTVCLMVLLLARRGSFSLGSRSRPRVAVVVAALGAWAMVWSAKLVEPLILDRGHTVTLALRHTFGHVLKSPLAHPPLHPHWALLVELLVGCAIVVSLLALRSWTGPVGHPEGQDEHEARLAAELLARYGEDSISPFILRPDKSLHFAAGGVLAYRTVGSTAIVSGDPVAPPGSAAEVLGSFLERARRSGWSVVVWGSSSWHLQAYETLKLRHIRLGEEAFVDPADFTLEGRSVRKLRQSVNRLERRGWRVEACDGRELDPALTSEIEALRERWRGGQPRIHGFAMGMGAFGASPRPTDLFLLARSPDEELLAVMKFVGYRGRLSLDEMHRVGQTPNGLNEALICRALELARERGVPEVSLNYAGLGHLVRRGHAARGGVRLLARALSVFVGSRFQMAGLVQFDEKFNPQWRPRFLVYQSAAVLPMVALRVLQAEGYLPYRPSAASRRRPGLPPAGQKRKHAFQQPASP